MEPAPQQSPSEELQTLWRAKGISPDDIQERSDGTLVASDRRLAVRNSVLIAESVAQPAVILSNEPLALGRELGRGGMGVVNVATQRTMHREVAVKSVHGDAPQSTSAILKEAWVGGLLEHPNVVPVHTVVTMAGSPAVVMKRIEGASWSSVIADHGAYPRLAIHDPLEWHLRTLMQVCLAIELAHRKGIVHLDLKPDNVMIGEYGEVYVLDWGLAAAIGDGAPAWLARASDIRHVAGTPHYMAPELAMADGGRISERTDVYLLGAVLHHVLAGAPPHVASNAFATLYLAYESKAHEYRAEVPAELIAIVQRAMHKDPQVRFSSARALHDALGEFLSQRQARALVRQAEDGLDLLERAIEAKADEGRVQRLFGECRFALRNAEQVWSDSPLVRPLLQRLLERMFGRAIALEQLASAEALLSEMPSVPPSCESELEGLRARLRERDDRVRALERMRSELDLALGRTARRRITIALGAIWASLSAALWYADVSGLWHIGYREIFVEGVLIALGLGPYGVWRRAELFANTANVRWQLSMALTYFVVEGFFVASALLDVPFDRALALTPFFYCFVFAAVALMVDARIWVSAIFMAITAALCAVWPAHALLAIGLGGGAAVAGLARAWRE